MESRIKKYKTFKEAKSDQYVFYPDEEYLKKAFSLLRIRFLKDIGKKFPHGIFKYKTFEEAQKHLLDLIVGD